jgi:hypothetical protein
MTTAITTGRSLCAAATASGTGCVWLACRGDSSQPYRSAG